MRSVPKRGLGTERIGIFLNITSDKIRGGEHGENAPRVEDAAALGSEIGRKIASMQAPGAELTDDQRGHRVGDSRDDKQRGPPLTEVGAGAVAANEDDSVEDRSVEEKQQTREQRQPLSAWVLSESETTSAAFGEVEAEYYTKGLDQFATESEVRIFSSCSNETMSFTIEFVQMRPKTRGRVVIQSRQVEIPPLFEFPRIDDDDYRYMADMAVWAAQQLATPPLPPKAATNGEHEKFEAVQITDEPFSPSPLEAATNTARLYQHPCCTAGVGRVIDEYLQVKGASGLRVVDASSWDVIPSSHIAAPTMALGYLSSIGILRITGK